MCCRRRQAARVQVGIPARFGFAKIALKLLQVVRNKRLWGLTGHYLQDLKRQGTRTSHAKILGKRWAVRGSKRNIAVHDED